MHYHSILTYLTETALLIPFPSRQATLHACLASTQSFLSVLFSIPTKQYFKFTYVTWAQMMHTLGVLSKLFHFDSPDWDFTHVQGVVDLSLVLGGLIGKFEVLQAAGVNQDGLFARIIPRFRQFKEAFEEKRAVLVSAQMALSQAMVEPLPPAISQMDMGDGFGGVMFTPLDETFWQEIMADLGPVQPY